MLGLVTFDISSLNKSYLFALATLEAVDQPRISARKILRTIRKYENNFDVVGPSQLLSRIANAEPDTFITLTGFLTLRNRRLQIVAVETQPYGALNGLSTHPPRNQRYPAFVLAEQQPSHATPSAASQAESPRPSDQDEPV